MEDDTSEPSSFPPDRKIFDQPLESAMSFLVWSTGFWLGLDFGITGGLLSTPLFLEEYFPKNIISHSRTSDSLSCALSGNFAVNLYRSSIYLVACISAYKVTMFRIHTYTKMRICGWLLLIAMLISIYAINIGVITCSRILFGVGTGIAIEVVVTHPSETAPCVYRRRVMTLFPQAISSGILVANLWFYAIRIISTKGIDLAAGSSASLAFVLTFSVTNTICTSDDLKHLFDSSSQVAKNYVKSLGPASYEATVSIIRQVQLPPSRIIFQRKYMPPLVIAIFISVFQQLTGAYAFMIYAPVLFKTVGLGKIASLLCSSVMYGVNWVVTGASIAKSDKFERRTLFIQGGTAMLMCQIIITFIVRAQDAMPKWNAVLLVVAMCAYVAGFAWSWGPLGWLVPSEILPLEIQSVAYSLFVGTNMLSMFFVTQFFTIWFCEVRFCMQIVILSSILLMTIFVWVFLPETKGVEVGNVSKIWATHWLWKKFIEEDNIVVV